MLELNNLSVGYDGRYVIRNVDLSFEPGNIYTIIGKNGMIISPVFEIQ